MALCESRLATSSDISTLYDLLNEHAIEHDLGDVFTNSQQNFRGHFEQGLFKALVIEVIDETDTERKLIGCGFLSFPYVYLYGKACFLNCCYVRPAYRDHGLDQDLIKLAEKVCLDEGIHTMLITADGRDFVFKSTLQAEGARNITTFQKGASDIWFMPNASSKPQFLLDDYVIREATSKDLGDVHSLLESLIRVKNIKLFVDITREEFEEAGAVDKDLFGAVILEHRCHTNGRDGETKVRRNIVGCMIYTKMYHALKGMTYYLQGLYVIPNHGGRGLGKALVRASIEACQKRNSDGFIFMIHHENYVSQALFKSLQGTSMTQSKHIEPYLLRL